jgi:hypothetical protein
MAFDKIQSKESDLDRTDKLPILGASRSMRTSRTTRCASITPRPCPAPRLSRAPSADYRLERPRSALARGKRALGGGAHCAAKCRLRGAQPPVREGAGCAARRGHARRRARLGARHGALALAVEQHRARELQTALIERNTAAEQVRVRAEEALRESERAQSEARTLREALLSRDATIAQGPAFAGRARRPALRPAARARESRSRSRSPLAGERAARPTGQGGQGTKRRRLRST